MDGGQGREDQRETGASLPPSGGRGGMRCVCGYEASATPDDSAAPFVQLVPLEPLGPQPDPLQGSPGMRFRYRTYACPRCGTVRVEMGQSAGRGDAERP